MGGLVHIVQSIQGEDEAGTGWRLVQAIASLCRRSHVEATPGVGMVGIAIAMTFYFFVSATVRERVRAPSTAGSGLGMGAA